MQISTQPRDSIICNGVPVESCKLDELSLAKSTSNPLKRTNLQCKNLQCSHDILVNENFRFSGSSNVLASQAYTLTNKAIPVVVWYRVLIKQIVGNLIIPLP